MPITYAQGAPNSAIETAVIENGMGVAEGFLLAQLAQTGSFLVDPSLPASGSLFVRDRKALLKRGGAGGKSLPTARAIEDRTPLLSAPFALKQYDNVAQWPLSFLASNNDETYMAIEAAAGMWRDLEFDVCKLFLSHADNDPAAGGWLESDWVAELGGALIGSSDSTMDTLHAAYKLQKVAGGVNPNTLIVGGGVAEALRSDPQVLQRIVTKSAAAGQDANGIAMIGGNAVMSIDHVKAVMSEHLGLNVLVADGMRQDAGTNAYIADDAMWLGYAGTATVSGSGGQRVVGARGGAFVGLFQELGASVIGEDPSVKPQYVQAVSESIGTVAILAPAEGRLIKNVMA
tara:strand:- start:185 stop:1219 length:1035 start_codon:yes stop_codon:yes gene_type:complete